MVRTRVGYAGGTRAAPTYRSIGDHSETIQIDFDPALISYRQLLDIFWNSHDPSSRPWSRQYMAAVFHHNEEQKRLALETREQLAKRRNLTIRTEIVPFTGFTLAEDYHQKYYLRNRRDLMREFQRRRFTNHDLVHSTAAARVNGYIGGHGQPEQAEEELELLDLSAEGEKILLGMIRQRQ